MSVKTPSFWYSDAKSLPSMLLLPFSAFYYVGHVLHQSLGSPEASPIPIICLGNLTAGGSGKTPSALMVMKIIQDRNLASYPGFLTRGYGRDTTITIKALKTHNFSDIGDEAMLLRQTAPTYISANRKAGLNLALKDETDCLIMDDGYQNTQLQMGLRGLVVNSYDGFGNKRLLPSGPLRQPVKDGLKKANFIIYIDDPRGHRVRLDDLHSCKNIFKASMKIKTKDIDFNSKYHAFSGIARPDKFFSSLEEIGVKLENTSVFADHHPFTRDEIQHLVAKADDNGHTLITTEKDYVRIPVGLRKHITPIQSILVPHDEDALAQYLAEFLNEKS